MAANVKINNVNYTAVPSISVPKADSSGNATFFNTSDANGTPSNTPAGVTAYNANGKYQGTATFPSVSQDSSTKVLSIS